MRHHERRVSAKLDGEIAIGDRVYRVFAYAVEAELLGHHQTVDRERSAGQRRGPSGSRLSLRRHSANRCASRASISKYAIRWMAERQRLRRLQVRVTRHHGLGVLVRRSSSCRCRLGERLHVIDCGAQVEPQASVATRSVARAPGVQPLARLAYELGQAPLDVEMDVLRFE